jgi:trk system potassium uptake protein TrkH
VKVPQPDAVTPRAERSYDSFVARQATELRYAVRFRVVFKYFGQLCLVLAVLTMVPLVMSLIFGERYITL